MRRSRIWSVVQNEHGSDRAVAVVVADERYAPLRAFFWSAREGDYTSVIKAALVGVGSGLDDVGVTFPGDLDPGDEPFAGDEVEVYDPLADVRMPTREFLEALLAVSRTALDRNGELNRLNRDEEPELRAAVDKLDTHLRLISAGEHRL